MANALVNGGPRSGSESLFAPSEKDDLCLFWALLRAAPITRTVERNAKAAINEATSSYRLDRVQAALHEPGGIRAGVKGVRW
jgi:hypothetical protein